MQIISSKKLNTPLAWYWDDGISLYTMQVSDNIIEINNLDTESFDSISTFLTHYKPNLLVKPTADKNCLYLPSIDGRIIGIDKFSGQMLVDIDLGMMNCISEPKLFENYIYTICNVPLSNKPGIHSRSIVICKNDLDTGTKIGQSQLFQGKFSSLFLINNHFYIIVDEYLYQMSENLEVLQKIKINSDCFNEIISVKNKIVISSNLGYLEIVDEKSLSSEKFIFNKNRVSPVCINEDLIWFTEKKIIIFNIKNKTLKFALDTNIAYSNVIVKNHSVFATDDLGNISCLDGEKGSLDRLGVSSIGLKHLITIDNFIFTGNHKELYKICTTAV